MDICREAKQQGVVFYTKWLIFTGREDIHRHNGEEEEHVDALPDAADIISSIDLSFPSGRATCVGAYVAKK
jgi:hypothetical protein